MKLNFWVPSWWQIIAPSIHKQLLDQICCVYLQCWTGSRWDALDLCTSGSVSSTCTCSGTCLSVDPRERRCTAAHQPTTIKQRWNSITLVSLITKLVNQTNLQKKAGTAQIQMGCAVQNCCWTNLEGVNISQSVLHMAVNHQLAETQHLSTQVEGIAESGLLSLLGDRNKIMVQHWWK